MTIRLPLIEHIKVMFRNLNNDKGIVLNGPGIYEVETLPSWRGSGIQQNILSSAHTIRSRATVAAPLVFTRASRFWSVNQDSSWYAEHTRSNLG